MVRMGDSATDGGAEQVYQQTLDGDKAEEDYRPPDTFVVCSETGSFLLRSERHDWPHDTVSVEEWFKEEHDPNDDIKGDIKLDESVGSWWDITLSYTVDYRFRVPAHERHRAEEIAKELKWDAPPADEYHVNTARREVDDIKRSELPDDWDPYGETELHEVLLEDGDG